MSWNLSGKDLRSKKTRNGSVAYIGLISLLCTEQVSDKAPSHQHADHNDAGCSPEPGRGKKTSPRHLSPICHILLPGVPNDVGRHPQWNLPPNVTCSFGKSRREQMSPTKTMNRQLFLRFGRLWQVVVKDIGVLPINIFHVQQLHCAGFCFVMFRPPPNRSEFGR